MCIYLHKRGYNMSFPHTTLTAELADPTSVTNRTYQFRQMEESRLRKIEENRRNETRKVAFKKKGKDLTKSSSSPKCLNMLSSTSNEPAVDRKRSYSFENQLSTSTSSNNSNSSSSSYSNQSTSSNPNPTNSYHAYAKKNSASKEPKSSSGSGCIIS